MNKIEIASNAELAANGDQSAITTLYNYTYPSMYRLIYNLCGSRETAEDILQESYIKAFDSLKRLRSKRQFYPWLRIIMVNTWINYSKQNKNILQEISLEELTEGEKISQDDIYEFSERSEAESELLKAVETLPENQRICVLLFYYNEMSVEEISKALGIPKGSVKSRLHYARLKLKDKLGDSAMFGGMAASAAQGGGSEIMLTRILAALTETGGSHAVSGSAVGLIGKLAAGLVSVGMFTGGVIYTSHEFKRREDSGTVKPTAVSTSMHTTSSSLPTASTTAATTQSSAPSVTTTTAATTYCDFDWREVEGGVEILGFSGNSVDVTIPSKIMGKKVVSIASNAFHGRADISSVDIPSSVGRIGDNAFRDCKGMTSLKLHGGLNYIGDMTFLGCESLTSVSIPGSVSRVGIYAFAYCTRLNKVVVGNGVKRIGYCAFKDCGSLQSVSLSESVNDIGNNAFSGCSSELTLLVKEGTYSHDYGISEGINLEIS